jgi:hypothetical protein
MNPQVPRELLEDAVAMAESWLKEGESFAPFMIIDHWADRRTEQFEPQDLHGAKSRFRELMQTAPGEESCALVYVGQVADGDDAIVVECGRGGQREAEVFVQEFRHKRGPLRGFKLVGDARSVGITESVA